MKRRILNCFDRIEKVANTLSGLTIHSYGERVRKVIADEREVLEELLEKEWGEPAGSHKAGYLEGRSDMATELGYDEGDLTP